MQNVQNEPRIEPENAINNDLPAIYPTEQEIYEKKGYLLQKQNSVR